MQYNNTPNNLRQYKATQHKQYETITNQDKTIQYNIRQRATKQSKPRQGNTKQDKQI